MKKKLQFLLTAVLTVVGSISFGQTVTTFNYTGAVQYYVVPGGVTSIQIEAYGAQGGSVSGFSTVSGALGGYVIADLPVTPGETLEIYVGGEGGAGTLGVAPGGWNGGGASGNCTGAQWSGSGGGGASDVRQGGSAIADRIIVAGGGGGAHPINGSSGGAGGGLIAGNAATGSNGCIATYATGGTQAAGGASCTGTASCCFGTATAAATLGVGADGAGPATSCNGGDSGSGGGGGYYGGGGGFVYSAGGGGSSYTDPGASNVSHSQGVRTGDGEVIITVLCTALTTSVSATTVCENEQVTLSATGNGTVTWDNGVVDNVPFAPPVGSTTYTATSTDPNECGFSVTITVDPLPTVDAGTDVSLCDTTTSVTLTGSGSADSYTWDNGVTDGVAFMPSSGSTTYTVVGTDAVTGCTNTDDVIVTVSSPIIIAGNMQDDYFGGGGAVDITVSGGNAPYTYAWDNGAGTTEDITGVSPGTYTVVVTDANGCTSSAVYIINSVVSVDDITMDSFGLYPNPTTNGEFSIQTESDIRSIKIIDMSGRVIDVPTNIENGSVNGSSLMSGKYIVQVVTTDDVVARGTIVIQR